MKKLLTAIAAALFILCPAFSFSSYIIHLKDGREFATDQYYEEGDQIKFKRYGGIIGIQKDLVKEIEEVEEVEKRPVVVKKSAPEPETPAAGAETAEIEKTEEGAEKAEVSKQKEPEGAEGKEKDKDKEKPVEISEEEKKKAEQEKAAKMQAFLEEKRQIMREMEIATSALKEAKEKNNKAEKRKWWMERSKLHSRLSQLQESVKAANNGKLPDWWQNEL